MSTGSEADREALNHIECWFSKDTRKPHEVISMGIVFTSTKECMNLNIFPVQNWKALSSHLEFRQRTGADLYTRRNRRSRVI